MNIGNFGKNYVKQVVVRDNDGNEVEIVLKYSARTPLLYMNYFGTDMFNDLAGIVIQSAKHEDVIEKIEKDGAESLTDDELGSLNMTAMFDFYEKFAVSLIATAHYPKPLSYDYIIENMIPEDFITNSEYEPLFIAIKELFDPVCDDYKKKLEAAVATVGKKKRT